MRLTFRIFLVLPVVGALAFAACSGDSGGAGDAGGGEGADASADGGIVEAYADFCTGPMGLVENRSYDTYLGRDIPHDTLPAGVYGVYEVRKVEILTKAGEWVEVTRDPGYCIHAIPTSAMNPLILCSNRVAAGGIVTDTPSSLEGMLAGAGPSYMLVFNASDRGDHEVELRVVSPGAFEIVRAGRAQYNRSKASCQLCYMTCEEADQADLFDTQIRETYGSGAIRCVANADRKEFDPGCYQGAYP